MSTITAKGQTTIPKPIRDHLRLKPGDRLDFVIEPDGGVRMIAKTLQLADLHGMLPRPTRRVSVEAMNEAIATAAVRRFRRSLPAAKARARKAKRKGKRSA